MSRQILCRWVRYPRLLYESEWVWLGVAVDVQVLVRSVVWESWWAQSASGFRNSGIWGFPIPRAHLGDRVRGTTAPLFRARRGPEGSAVMVVAVVLAVPRPYQSDVGVFSLR